MGSGGTKSKKSTSNAASCAFSTISNVSPGKYSNSLNFFYTNATSLVNKWSDFNSLISFLNYPHVILITETWFNALSICKLDNYKTFSKNRVAVRGGGVAIFVRSDVESFEVSEAALCSTRSEQVWCKVKVNDELILVGCVYRPPFADCEINLEINKSIGYASHLCSSAPSKSLLVAGDFNYPDINWNHEGGFCANKGRPSSLEFLNTMAKNFLTQHVLEPTFKNNTLDLVVTNDPARVFRVVHGPPLGSSDKDCLHATLSWSYELRSQLLAHSDSSSPRQVLALGNYELFSERFHDGSKLLDIDVNTAYNQVVESYSQASSIAIPTRRLSPRKRPSPKWFNDRIKHLTKRKYKLHCQVRAAPRNPELRAAYILVCKQVKSAVRHSICKFEESIVRACKRQPKLLFNYINSQKQCKDTIKGLLDNEGFFCTDGGTIANLLNAHFASVFSVIFSDDGTVLGIHNF